MNKLFNIKKWVSIEDAAGRLSSVIDETVSESDILRLGLDGSLQISTYLVNSAYARRGTVVGIDEAKRLGPLKGMLAKIIRGDDGKSNDDLSDVITSRYLGEGKFLNVAEDVESIDGVWDLTMLGGDRHDVEHQYQYLTGGPEVTLIDIDGVLLRDEDGNYWELAKRFDKDRPAIFQKPEMGKQESSSGADSGSNHENKGQESDAKDPPRRKPFYHPDNFYPAGGLPEDSTLVVRTDALLEFERGISQAGEAQDHQSELSESERRSVLKILLGMAIDCYDYDPKAARNVATGENRGSIAAALQLLDGLSTEADTIRKYLKEAAELYPDAKPRKH